MQTLLCIPLQNILSGHSDVIMGALVMNDEKLYQDLSFIMNSCGAVPGPQDSFLVLRGIKTLAPAEWNVIVIMEKKLPNI